MKQPDLGKKIAELRKSKGLTQEELVEKCNLNVRTLQRIESGEVVPRNYTIKAIFTALDYNGYDSDEITPNKFRETRFIIFSRLEQFYRYFLDLFNLKTNTMKKISILLTIIVCISLCLFGFKSEFKKTVTDENKPIVIIKNLSDSIVYIGFKNPIYVYTKNADTSLLHFEIDNGRIENNNGNYTIIARSIGEVTLYVYYNKQLIKLLHFKSDIIPTPTVSVIHENMGRIDKKDLKQNEKVFKIHSINDLYEFEIVGFSITINNKVVDKKIVSKSGLYSKEQLEFIKTMNTGDIITFSDISCMGPEGIIRMIEGQKNLIIL